MESLSDSLHGIPHLIQYFLFGEFCAADAMFAPVTSRFRTYGVDLGAHGDDGTAQAYCEAILSLAEIEEWTQGGRAEMNERGTAY